MSDEVDSNNGNGRNEMQKSKFAAELSDHQDTLNKSISGGFNLNVKETQNSYRSNLKKENFEESLEEIGNNTDDNGGGKAVNEDFLYMPVSVFSRANEPRAPYCSLSNSSDIDQERITNNKMYLLAKSLLNHKNVSLSNEELERKFEELNFAFKIDSTTVEKRLHLLRRKRDQAEINARSQLEAVKMQIKALQQFAVDVDQRNAIAKLIKELDFVLNATMQFTSSSEAYGYTQHEEQMLEFVGVMARHLENLEIQKMEAVSLMNKMKAERKRAQGSSDLLEEKNDVDDHLTEISRTNIESLCRRRASIAIAPIARNLKSQGELKGTRRCTQHCTEVTTRSDKKLIPLQSSHVLRNLNNNIVEDVEVRNESSFLEESGVRSTKNLMENNKNKMKEESLKNDNVKAEENGRQWTTAEESRGGEVLSPDTVENLDEDENALVPKRRVGKWRSWGSKAKARLQWPASFSQWLPFCFAWYLIFIFVLGFCGGVLIGMNGRFLYTQFQYATLSLGFVSFITLARRFYRFIFTLVLIIAFELIVLLVWVVPSLLHNLSDEEINNLFRPLDPFLKIRYVNGPPPF